MFPRFQNIKGPLNWLSVLTDLLMLGLTIFDLAWLMFDALYSMHTIKALVDPILPFYQSINEEFYFYDGIIVSIFILEFSIRWLVSIQQKAYSKWFFYPFIHWYDVLGCFPTSSFRILRLFRVIGLTYRLHRWQVINLNDYVLFTTLVHYYNIAIEEISDLLVVKILSQAKDGIHRGKPLNEAILKEVIQPRQTELAQLISANLQKGLEKKYPQYQKLLKKHVIKTVEKTVINNPEVQQIKRIPVVGAQIQSALNTATSQIVFGVVDQLILDFSAKENQAMVALITESVLEVLLQHQSSQSTNLTNEMLVESIDLIVKRVQIKQWKSL
jgi:hypothetical protein